MKVMGANEMIRALQYVQQFLNCIFLSEPFLLQHYFRINEMGV